MTRDEVLGAMHEYGFQPVPAPEELESIIAMSEIVRVENGHHLVGLLNARKRMLAKRVAMRKKIRKKIRTQRKDAKTPGRNHVRLINF